MCLALNKVARCFCPLFSRLKSDDRINILSSCRKFRHTARVLQVLGRMKVLRVIAAYCRGSFPAFIAFECCYE